MIIVTVGKCSFIIGYNILNLSLGHHIIPVFIQVIPDIPILLHILYAA